MSGVEDYYKGQFYPQTFPFDDPQAYGSVKMEPTGDFPARSYQTFTITYTVGPYGIDEFGGVTVAINGINDAGIFQFTEPTKPNYCTAKTVSKGAGKLIPKLNQNARRPWNRTIHFFLTNAYVTEGEKIVMTIGDTSQGSPGWQLGTYTETGMKFRVMPDVCNTGEGYPLKDSPTINVVGGTPYAWKAVMPSRRNVGDTFKMGVKVEDYYGNPTFQDVAGKKFFFKTTSNSPAVKGMPVFEYFPERKRAFTVTGLSCSEPGEVQVEVYDEDNNYLTTSNTCYMSDTTASADSYPHTSMRTFWGDLHGQSGETVGTNTIQEYLEFARDMAFLDVSGHQGNDFQILKQFWEQLNETTKAMDKKNEFVVFPGYEWSGNTPVGGDHNVFYLNENEPIYRSSHAIIGDRTDMETDATTSAKLFEKLKKHQAIVYSHVGGRPANVAYAHEPSVCTSVETHSDWGTFDWILWDSLELGHRVGVVCNSDGHKGQPGASYPGAAEFGSYGGLTCFITNELNRQSIYKCIKSRHHYGTTGCRLHMETYGYFNKNPDENSATNNKTSDEPTAWYYETDPAYTDCQGTPTKKIMMGDIASTTNKSMSFSFNVKYDSNVERVDVFNGTKKITTYKGYTPSEAHGRMRVTWEGAECRGRARRTTWDGTVEFKGMSVTKMVPLNNWNKEWKFEMKRVGYENDKNYVVDFKSATTGNWAGFDIWYSQYDDDATMYINTHNVKDKTVYVKDVGFEDTTFEAGELYKKFRCFSMPSYYDGKDISRTFDVEVEEGRDNPFYVRVTTEDGYNAWSSPMYVFIK